MAECLRSFHLTGRWAAALHAETRETDKPKGRVVIIVVQLIEVVFCQHTSRDEAFFEELVRHLDEPRISIATPPDHRDALMPQILHSHHLKKRRKAAPERGVHRPGSLHGSPQGPLSAIEFGGAGMIAVGRP